ncbi:MAG: Hsp70 family protein [Phycisphaerae bacterium]|nr:Hsp70 family protein [Phycisphaerae bacterium]
MVRLGIDFGTTNTVAAIFDRGLFSVVLHQAQTRRGTIVQEIFPSAILVYPQTHQRWFGLEADRKFVEMGASSDLIFIPSLKRELRNYMEGKSLSPNSACDSKNGGAGQSDCDLDLADLFTDFLRALADSIRRSQMLDESEPLETVITWPAHSNGAQRHITRECFRRAGFRVINALNEPTASAVELADCLTGGKRNGKSEDPYAVAVFDLGGGTFDASVVRIEGHDFHVVTSGGIELLGGDDFDRILLEMFEAKLDLPSESISALTRHALLRQARAQKELISTGTVKSLFLNPQDFGLRGKTISLPVDLYRERICPLLDQAVSMLREVIQSAAAKWPGMNGGIEPLTIYLVGGSSKLPFVSEMVSGAFPGSRVILSDKPFQSVALGAAICAADRISYHEVFARHFGLIRLKDHGQTEIFDTIFPAGTPIPRRGESPLEKVVRYRPAHNIGHLRYLECTSLGPDGMPLRGVRTWSDILFPYDPNCPLSAPVSKNDIIPTNQFNHLEVSEIYRCDSDGVITVEIQNPARNESRRFEIFNE